MYRAAGVNKGEMHKISSDLILVDAICIASTFRISLVQDVRKN